jgi:hypothetical protein
VTPPPIRYPLPTLILTVVLGLLAWKGVEWTRPLRAALAERWSRLIEGPPPPASDRPMVVAGPIVRRVLLLRDGVAATDRPGGRTVETIRLRQFADVYDVWPLKGTPTHYRIGNRRPIGWVPAADVLPWDTRLVLKAPRGTLALADATRGAGGTAVEVGEVPMPVLAWRPGAVEVAAWDRDHPWERVARTAWAKADDVPRESWGVLLSEFEVRELLDAPADAKSPAGAGLARLRAVLGRLGDPQPVSRADLDAARAALPGLALAEPATSATDRREELLRIFERWAPDASWAGFTFRAIPLGLLP